MKHKRLILAYGFLTLAAIVVVATTSCSGGGGAIGTPSSAPPPVNATFATLLTPAQKGATYVGSSRCASCHTLDSQHFAATVHAQHGVTCESCHGPASAHVANPQTTNILTFANPAVKNGNVICDITAGAVCAQCHGQQYTDWYGTAHAQIITDPVNSASATCLRCHSAEMRDQFIDSPLGLGQTAAQVNTTITALPAATLTGFSVPATDATAANTQAATEATAACVVCHDPHQQTANTTTNPDAAGNTQFMLRRATSSQDTADLAGGTLVATYTTYNQLCGACHNSRGSDSSDAGLLKSTSRGPSMGREMNMLLGITGAQGGTTPPQQTSSHVNVPDQCMHCHMPNASHTFTVNLDISCVPCHTAADAAARETAVQSQTLNSLIALQTEMQNWSLAYSALPANGGVAYSDWWNYTGSIAEAFPATLEANVPIQVMRARYNYEDIITDASFGVHNWAYTDYLLQESQAWMNQVTPAVAIPNYTVAQAKSILAPQIARIKASSVASR